MGEGVHTLNPLFWKIQSYGTYQVIHLHCKITFKMANKQKISLEPRSWKKKIVDPRVVSICTWSHASE